MIGGSGNDELREDSRKHSRCIATCDDKTDSSFLAFIAIGDLSVAQMNVNTT